MTQNPDEKQPINWKSQAEDNPHFCILPFIHGYVTTSGMMTLCCVADWKNPIAENVVGKNLDELWRGEKYQKARETMLSGEPDARCTNCYHQDANGGGSDREAANQRYMSQTGWDIDVKTGNTTEVPLLLDLRPGRMCNFKCRMCWGDVSSAIAEEQLAHPELEEVTGHKYIDVADWLDDPEAFEVVKQWLPKTQTLKLAGGEPLFMQGVLKLLNWCIESGNTHIHLDITTNGSRVKGKVIRMLSQFSRVDIQFSMCGIGYPNDYIRNGAVWEELDAAYKLYRSMPNVTTHLMATAQLYNVYDLTNILQYWIDNGAAGNLIFNLVEYPEALSVDLLPIEERRKVAAEIQALAMELPERTRHRSRVNFLVNRLLTEFDEDDINVLRKNWATRTTTFDLLRGEDIHLVHPKLGEYYDQWLSE